MIFESRKHFRLFSFKINFMNHTPTSQTSPSIFYKILNDSRSVGIILIICTIISLIWSNSSSGVHYISFWTNEWNKELIKGVYLPNNLTLIVNDVLMAFFFFMVGLEIKREMKVGELSSLKQASFPIFAAIGGVLVPAALYAVFNFSNPETSHGWGVPMATDIAFALGVLALVGTRAPIGLKVLLAALAIIDDLMAILVIAIFYTEEIKTMYLMGCFALIIILAIMNFRKITIIPLYILIGIILWYFMYNSGVHATLAAVILAFTIPLDKIPSLEKMLHHPVSFIVLPIFALANTAIAFPGDFAAALNSNVSHGIMAGLMAGKPLGIVLIPLIMVKFKMASLPKGVAWKHIVGMGLIAGIGFTMSIFISDLAFTHPEHKDIAKISVLFASTLSAVIGVVYLIFIGKKSSKNE